MHNMLLFPTLVVVALASCFLVTAEPLRGVGLRTPSPGVASLKAVRKIDSDLDGYGGLLQHAQALARRRAAIPEGINALLQRITGKNFENPELTIIL